MSDLTETEEFSNEGLTSAEKYGKTTNSRVTVKEYTSKNVHTVIVESELREAFSLPLVEHNGHCFIALARGVVVDGCECFEGEVR